MENQAGDTPTDAQPQTFQPPATGYPPPFPQAMPPGYPPPFQQAYPQPPQYYYPMMPAQDLPPSPFPLQTPKPRNVLATLSIVVAVLAGILHYVLYAFYFFSSIAATTTRAEEIDVYRNSALYQILPLLVAIGAFGCAIVALSHAKNHAWNGLIPALVGLVSSAFFLYAAFTLIFEFLMEANVLQNLVR